MRGYNPQDCLHTDRVGKEFEHSCIVLWRQKFEFTGDIPDGPLTPEME